jgi:Toxin co-regulated pilus biosynthesis protein Q/Conjugal transfer protein
MAMKPKSIVMMVLTIGALAACAVPNNNQLVTAQAKPQYDFSYAVTGDSKVRPSQAFSDGASIYVQLRQNQVIAPDAVKAFVDGQWRPVSSRRMGQYLIVDGPYKQLSVESVEGLAAYVSHSSLGPVAAPVPASMVVPAALAFNVQKAAAITDTAPSSLNQIDAKVASETVALSKPIVATPSPQLIPPLPAPTVNALVVPGATRFAVRANDMQAPQLIARWAKVANYQNVTINGVSVSVGSADMTGYPIPSESKKIRTDVLDQAVDSLLKTSGYEQSISVTKDLNRSVYAISVRPAALQSASGPTHTVAAAVVQQSATVAPKSPPAELWKVELRDVTLANTFDKWAKAAGWRIKWDADKNIMVEAPDEFGGTFEQALTEVLSSPAIAQGPYPLEVCFYANQPPFARVTRKGDQYKECK